MLVDFFVYYNCDICYIFDDFVLRIVMLGVILFCLGWGLSFLELMFFYDVEEFFFVVGVN